MSLSERCTEAGNKVGIYFKDHEDWPDKMADTVLYLRGQIEFLGGQLASQLKTAEKVKKCGITFLPGEGRCANT